MNLFKFSRMWVKSITTDCDYGHLYDADTYTSSVDTGLSQMETIIPTDGHLEYITQQSGRFPILVTSVGVFDSHRDPWVKGYWLRRKI